MLNQIRKWCGSNALRAVAFTALLSSPAMPALAADTDGDLFYVAPDPIPVGQPGDVIRTRPSKAGPPTARSLANAWQVMFRSTNSIGEAMVITGTVLVPKTGDTSTMPIVSFAPGTSGPAFRCTPSRLLNKGAFYEQAAVNEMLAEGYVVVMADYEGYHPDPRTTYMVESMGSAVIDVVRAAMNMDEINLSPTAPVFFRGYSQGGGAVMRAGEMQPTYAPELNLAGVAGGGVPSNLALVALPLDGKQGFGFMLYALLGQDNAYPEISLDPYLNEQGKTIVENMENDWCIIELLQDAAGLSINDIAPGALNTARFARLSALTLGAKPIEAPVFQYHEGQDGLVAFGQASQLRDAYCEQGVDLEWLVLDTEAETPITRHIHGVYQGNDEVMAFIKDRIDGKPSTPNCP